MAGRKSNIAAVIVAAGSGRRFGGRTPKQFARLRGKPILLRSLEVFDSLSEVSEIVVVASARHIDTVERLLKRGRLRKVKAVVPGGRRRQDSVFRGLLAFRQAPDSVLVHDAARPLLTAEFVRTLLRLSRRHKALVPGLPVTETLKRVGRGGVIDTTIDRTALYSVQTPQVFRYGLLLKAHQHAANRGYHATDDASLVEFLGEPVYLAPGLPGNIKVTVPADLKTAGILLGMAK